jgi:hypothetical protein
VTHDGFCDECERIYRRNEGPQGARYYLYSVREIAKALIDVGKGSSYRGTAFGVRSHARRGRKLSKRSSSRHVRYSEHAQLVSDWVEVFAPVVFEPHRDFAWPTTGSVVLDELPFRIQGGASTFSILAAMGWDEGRREMRLWRLEAVPVRRDVTASWCRFLRSLEGRPERVVCDRGNTLVKAIDEVWPESQRHYCEYHLKERCCAITAFASKARHPMTSWIGLSIPCSASRRWRPLGRLSGTRRCARGSRATCAS